MNADSKPHPGLSAYLTHPNGRRVGIKHIWRGEAVQTWALDVPPREFDNDGDAETYADSLKHLTPGIRYNVGVCFTNNPPAATTARNIRTRLLPAFDGRRPLLRAFPKKPSRRTAVAEKPPAAANATTSSEPTQAADQPQPEKATAKTAAPARSPRRTVKKAQPTAKKTEPKKQPAAPRSKRLTAKTTKTASPDETTAKKKSQSTETTTGN
ncbi:hypothetical protein [Streptomyces sp. NPDC020996]|uniref:hypothetical protein n=1 Tax=Streptomyces sp. NPDC020996 TaxID=3154791 RepID=UPI0033FEFAA7